jgi:hypothetical protein
LILFSEIIVRRWFRAEDFVPRTDEVAMGRVARALAKPGELILVEAVDYGHFAVAAAIGRPEDVLVDRELDPRKGPTRSSFEDVEVLSERVRETGARWVIGRLSRVTKAALGEPKQTHGAWALWNDDGH